MEFFENFRHKRYGLLVPVLYSKSKSLKNKAGLLAKDFGTTAIKSFKIVEITDEAPAISVVSIIVSYIHDEMVCEVKLDVRMIYEDDNMQPLLRNDPNGKWMLIQNSINDLIYGVHTKK